MCSAVPAEVEHASAHLATLHITVSCHAANPQQVSDFGLARTMERDAVKTATCGCSESLLLFLPLLLPLLLTGAPASPQVPPHAHLSLHGPLCCPTAVTHMPLELISGQLLTKAVDVYSFGVILIEVRWRELLAFALCIVRWPGLWMCTALA